MNLILCAVSVDQLNSNLPREMWSEPDASNFQVRDRGYFEKKKKVEAGPANFKLVGMDLFSFKEAGRAQTNIGARPESAVQQATEFTFIINFVIPGPGNIALVMYFQASHPSVWERNPLLQSFIEGDDEYRTSRFKLIPRIAKGNFVVKRLVGSKTALVSQRLSTVYTRTDKYFEIDLDIGSQQAARSIVGVVRGASKSVSVDMAFLIESQFSAELPEQILGAVNLNFVSLDNPVKIQ